jgi:hypothetical protein
MNEEIGTNPHEPSEKMFRLSYYLLHPEERATSRWAASEFYGRGPEGQLNPGATLIEGEAGVYGIAVNGEQPGQLRAYGVVVFNDGSFQLEIISDATRQYKGGFQGGGHTNPTAHKIYTVRPDSTIERRHKSPLELAPGTENWEGEVFNIELALLHVLFCPATGDASRYDLPGAANLRTLYQSVGAFAHPDLQRALGPGDTEQPPVA